MNGSSLPARCPRVRGEQKGGSRNVNTMTKRCDGQAREALCARGRGVAKRVQERGHRGGDTQEAGKEVQESPGKQGRKRYSRQMEKHVQRRREAQM